MNEDRVALVFGLLCAGSVVIVLLGLGTMIYAILTADTGRNARKRAVEERPVEERAEIEERYEIEERGRLRARRIEMRQRRRRMED